MKHVCRIHLSMDDVGRTVVEVTYDGNPMANPISYANPAWAAVATATLLLRYAMDRSMMLIGGPAPANRKG